VLSFQDLYQSHKDDVYRFCFWLAGNQADAEDITSDTFVRAWARRSAIRTQTLRAYLLTIARNVFLEQRRKRQRQVSLDDVYVDPAPGPERQVESQLEIVRVHRVLQSVTEIDRAAFILRVQHDLPYAEIARVLQISVPAAKVKVHRVRKKLIEARVQSEEGPRQ
jgi:RNA polymerase sigma-70 factor (ECF subfamily)